MGFLDVIKERDYPELSRCIFKSREFCPTRNKANEAEGDVKEIWTVKRIPPVAWRLRRPWTKEYEQPLETENDPQEPVRKWGL